MNKIDRQIDMNDTRIQITSTSLKLLWRIVEKQDEIIDWVNSIDRRNKLMVEKFNKEQGYG